MKHLPAHYKIASNDLLDRINGIIEAKDMPSLIHECFAAKIIGQFGCYNPHWWINIHEEYVAYSYADDAYSCGEYDYYEKYDTPEKLISSNPLLFEGDDWWFKPSNAI